MMLNITHIANTITKTFVQSVILELAKLIINFYVKLMYIMHTLCLPGDMFHLLFTGTWDLT